MVEVVAGRTYRVANEYGVTLGLGPAEPATHGDLSNFRVDGWYVRPDGEVLGVSTYTVTAVELCVATSTSESTEARHEADDQDMQHDGLPRMHKKRIRVRQLHALERIADALEVLAGVAMDAADALEAPEPSGAGGEDESLP